MNSKTLAKQISITLQNELSLIPPYDACIVGCATAFTKTPGIEVDYLIKHGDRKLVGGRLRANFTRTLLGTYKVVVIANRAEDIQLTQDELALVGLGTTPTEKKHRAKPEQLIDEHNAWVLHLQDGKTYFTNTAEAELTQLVTKLSQGQYQ